jgi:hypothetical protein
MTTVLRTTISLTVSLKVDWVIGSQQLAMVQFSPAIPTAWMEMLPLWKVSDYAVEFALNLISEKTGVEKMYLVVAKNEDGVVFIRPMPNRVFPSGLIHAQEDQ